MQKLKIAIVIGSVREGRFADRPADWIADIAARRSNLVLQRLDVREWMLPFLSEGAPGWGPSRDPATQRWRRKVAEFDGYIFIAAEYNRGPAAAMRNALDHAYDEWNRKPAAFVGYGVVGGARSIEQLRLNSIELQMAPVRTAVHIPWPVYTEVSAGKSLSDYPFLVEDAEEMLDQLVWWAEVLKPARERLAAANAA
jgi:NAD(P)H-dependent FMN reductase